MLLCARYRFRMRLLVLAYYNSLLLSVNIVYVYLDFIAEIAFHDRRLRIASHLELLEGV